MKKIFMVLFIAVLIMDSAIVFLEAEEVLRLATTTSTYETGLLDYIIPVFEKNNDCKVHIISVGTGKAIKLGENGDVDVILVHAREAEDKFVKEGYGINRKDVMYSDFIIIGPEEDPAGIRGSNDAIQSFSKIKKTESLFVSRGDDSGTHMKELAIWEKAGINVKELKHYLEVGQGMNQTLRVADEKNAYCLTDRASYFFNKETLRLILLAEKSPLLFNPYGVIAINPAKHTHINYKLAIAFINWLTSADCQKMIRLYKKEGNVLFYTDVVNQEKTD